MGGDEADPRGFGAVNFGLKCEVGMPAVTSVTLFVDEQTIVTGRPRTRPGLAAGGRAPRGKEVPPLACRAGTRGHRAKQTGNAARRETRPSSPAARGPRQGRRPSRWRGQHPLRSKPLCCGFCLVCSYESPMRTFPSHGVVKFSRLPWSDSQRRSRTAESHRLGP